MSTELPAEGRRRVVSYGWTYDFTRSHLDQADDDTPDWDEKAKRRTRLTEDGELLDNFDQEVVFRKDSR